MTPDRRPDFQNRPQPLPDLDSRPFVLGTRGSQLALWQAEHVSELLRQRWPGIQIRLQTFVTNGDKNLAQPLPEIGGKGLFTQELENALRAHQIDLVVHSLKDLPVEEAPGLAIAAIPGRENPRDGLISAQPWTLESLPHGARVGTSSLRRAAQLLATRPDLTLLPLRGNVDTRVRKALAGEFDAIILAAAGLLRLGLTGSIREELPLLVMLPAPGQGALAVQCRAEDDRLIHLLGAIDDPAARGSVSAERAFLAGLGGGCAAPIAAYADVRGGKVYLHGRVLSLDGQQVLDVTGSGNDPFTLGSDLAQHALKAGARDLLAREGEA